MRGCKATRLQMVGVALLACCLLLGCSTTALEPTPTPMVGTLTFAGSTSLQPLLAALGDVYQERFPGVRLDVAAGGSLVGIQAVHDGTIDIGMASRTLSAAEANDLDVHQIAVDVIAVIVHEWNPVESLTLDELRDIYAGKITNWAALGGTDTLVVPVARQATSGTRGAFDALVLGGDAPSAPALQTAVTAGDVASAVATDPAAIGYVGFGNLEEGTRIVAIGGVAPSTEAVRDGSYPLVRPLLLLTGSLSQPLADHFVSFALSPDGQAIVLDNGWVSVR